MGKFIDLTGKKFGRLTVIRRAKNKGKRATWLCKCECGIEKEIIGFYLRDGDTNSCGCLQRELTSKRSKTHGETNERVSAEYIIWAGMIQRCSNPNHHKYKDYGGRGISFDIQWSKYEKFLEDMGRRPSPSHSIERLNVNENYCKENCKWGTPEEQARNTRIRKTNKSGVNGVHRDKKNKWVAQIRSDGKQIYLGGFDSREKAAEARRQAEIKYWGKSS